MSQEAGEAHKRQTSRAGAVLKSRVFGVVPATQATRRRLWGVPLPLQLAPVQAGTGGGGASPPPLRGLVVLP